VALLCMQLLLHTCLQWTLLHCRQQQLQVLWRALAVACVGQFCPCIIFSTRATL
jgi:hypothetical protein